MSRSVKTGIKLAPYSKVFRRGAIGDSIDGRSTIGRFMRDMERQLIDHVGGNPTVTQRLLIERMVKVRLQLDSLDDKLTSGSWTPHDSRTYGGLLNAYRLLAREIGIEGAPRPQKTLAQHLASKAAAQPDERGDD